MADVDDQRAHHFGHNTVPPYITKTFKYEEDAILKQAEDYIAKTYELHYTSAVSYTHLTLPTKA